MSKRLLGSPAEMYRALAALLLPINAIILASVVAACAIFSHDPDLGAAADEVALYRADVTTLAPLAPLELQDDLARLVDVMLQVEGALRLADEGGPLQDAYDYAQAALVIAEYVATRLPEEDELRFAIAVAQVVLRHLAAGRV